MGFGSRFTCGYYWYCHVRYARCIEYVFLPSRVWRIIVFKLFDWMYGTVREAHVPEVQYVRNGFVDSIVSRVASASCGHESQVKCQFCAICSRSRALHGGGVTRQTAMPGAHNNSHFANKNDGNKYLFVPPVFIALVVVFVSAPNLHSRIELKCFRESDLTAVDISNFSVHMFAKSIANMHTGEREGCAGRRVPTYLSINHRGVARAQFNLNSNKTFRAFM